MMCNVGKVKRAVIGVAITVLLCATVLWLISALHNSTPKKPPSVRLALRAWQKDYFVKVRIQGKEGWMLLDTGSSCTLLLQPALEALAYTPLQTSETIFFPFADRTLTAHRVEVPEVAIGEWHISRLSALMTDQAQVAMGRTRTIDGLPVFGILGYDLLRQWRVISIDHHALILQQRSVVPPSSARVFRLVEIGGRPAISEQTAQTQPIVWLIDTGCESHLVSAGAVRRLTARVRAYRHGGKLVAPLALVALRDKREQALIFPAAIKPVGSPPFTRPDYESGLIGNALLQRYQMVLDHFYRRVWFVPIDSTPTKGTYGLLLFADRRQPKLYAHFVIPQVSGLPDGFVRIVAVDGVLVKEWDEALAHRLLRPRVGSSVRLEVELPNKRRQQVVCWAYAPDEAGLQLFWAHTRIGSLQLQHTVIQFKEELGLGCFRQRLRGGRRGSQRRRGWACLSLDGFWWHARPRHAGRRWELGLGRFSRWLRGGRLGYQRRSAGACLSLDGIARHGKPDHDLCQPADQRLSPK